MKALANRPMPIASRGEVVMPRQWGMMMRKLLDDWHIRRRERAALASMTTRELTDIGMTECDRSVALSGWHRLSNPH
jgi:uncharacterized protein YjiS (DUF1127 family)